MTIEATPLRKKIAGAGAEGALDLRTPGLIGYVVNYHRQANTCDCNRHKGEPISEESWHTVDVDVYQGKKKERYLDVPCFVYAQGIIDKGLVENDRVWVQFINGDPQYPVVTAYYRHPSGLEQFFNNLKYAISDFFGEIGWG